MAENVVDMEQQTMQQPTIDGRRRAGGGLQKEQWVRKRGRTEGNRSLTCTRRRDRAMAMEGWTSPQKGRQATINHQRKWFNVGSW